MSSSPFAGARKFVLNYREYSGTLWHQAERGVPAGAIERRGYHPSVKEAVLLRQIRPKWHPNLD
jgi:hypothetical protein